jgi:hypothetical protein
MKRVYKYLIALRRVTIVVVTVSVLLAVMHFPYDTDAPLTRDQVEAAQKYYTDAYQKSATEAERTSDYDSE